MTASAYKPTHGGYPGEVPESQPEPTTPGPLGLIVWPDGRKSYQRLPADLDAQYEALSNIVGGWIEYVFVTYGVHAYCNEEGKLKGLSPNPVATRLAGYEGVDILCGTVIFLGETGDGYEGDLPSEWQDLA